MAANKLILVTGASGYIAGLLIPRLLEKGFTVRCMVRDDTKLVGRPWKDEVEVVCADVIDQNTLTPALADVHTAYYLIHNMSSGHGYHQREMQGAHNFARAAHQAGVKHIIYLGGLADPHEELAPHMRSRMETGKALRENEVPVTEFRAGVIVGPGSISFEMIRYLSEQFPVLVGPNWLKNKSQPISAQNVVDYLIAAMETDQSQGKIIEIGGPDVMTYAETMIRYCRARRLARPLLTVPYIPTFLMAYLVDKLTPVQSSIASPLIGGLKSSSIVSDPQALEIFPQIVPQGFEESVQKALDKLHPHHLSRVWRAWQHNGSHIKSEGFLIFCQEIHSSKTPEAAYSQILAWAQNQDSRYQIEYTAKNQIILLKDTRKRNGKRWLEWEILPLENGQTVVWQTGFFAPRGLPGFLSRPGWQTELRKFFKEIIESLFI